MISESKLFIYTDGGARGNPGPAAIGVFIIDSNGQVLQEIGKTIGETTNNVAEYTAVLTGMNWILDNKELVGEYHKIIYYIDSQLVVQQLKGLYKIKSPHLRVLISEIKQKESVLQTPVEYVHVPREKNKEADRLVNHALDNE